MNAIHQSDCSGPSSVPVESQQEQNKQDNRRGDNAVETGIPPINGEDKTGASESNDYTISSDVEEIYEECSEDVRSCSPDQEEQEEPDHSEHDTNEFLPSDDEHAIGDRDASPPHSIEEPEEQILSSKSSGSCDPNLLAVETLCELLNPTNTEGLFGIITGHIKDHIEDLQFKLDVLDQINIKSKETIQELDDKMAPLIEQKKRLCKAVEEYEPSKRRLKVVIDTMTKENK